MVICMAYFENEGFCPSCSSFDYYPTEQRNNFVNTIFGILNGRQGLMVYAPNRKSWFDEHPSIVDAMLGGDGSLGIQIATILACAIPGFKLNAPNKDTIRKISLIDCLCPTDLGEDVFYDPSRGSAQNWQFFVDGRASLDNPVHQIGNRTIIHDTRYAVVLDDAKDGAFEIRLLRIPTRK